MSKIPGMIFIALGIAFLAGGFFCLRKTDRERELKAALVTKASLPVELHKVGHARAEQQLAWEIRAKRTRTAGCVALSLILFVSGLVVIKVSLRDDKSDAGFPPSTPEPRVTKPVIRERARAHRKKTRSEPARIHSQTIESMS